MELHFKTHKLIKIKNYIKKERIYFFFNGISKKSDNWIVIEQALRIINFNYFKVFNQTSKEILKHSIYRSIRWIINTITFFMRPNSKKLFKQVLISHFDLILFNMLAIKINNKIYQMTQLKKSYSLNHKNNQKLIFQFKLINLRKLK